MGRSSVVVDGSLTVTVGQSSQGKYSCDGKDFRGILFTRLSPTCRLLAGRWKSFPANLFDFEQHFMSLLFMFYSCKTKRSSSSILCFFSSSNAPPWFSAIAAGEKVLQSLLPNRSCRDTGDQKISTKRTAKDSLPLTLLMMRIYTGI